MQPWLQIISPYGHCKLIRSYLRWPLSWLFAEFMNHHWTLTPSRVERCPRIENMYMVIGPFLEYQQAIATRSVADNMILVMANVKSNCSIGYLSSIDGIITVEGKLHDDPVHSRVFVEEFNSAKQFILWDWTGIPNVFGFSSDLGCSLKCVFKEINKWLALYFLYVYSIVVLYKHLMK